MYSQLKQILCHLANARSLDDLSYLTSDLHVLPDYVGNKPPLADLSMKGMANIHAPPPSPSPASSLYTLIEKKTASLESTV